MRRKIGIGFILGSLLILPLTSLAYSSSICAGETCTTQEVGRFMTGVSAECGNQGDCSLSDILLLFINISYIVLGLIGSVVLFMYVLGGFYLLTSGGASSRVTKGKDYLKISTIGLLFVLFSYVGIQFLLQTLTDGNIKIPTEECIGKADGSSCADGSTCQGQICVPNS